MPKMKKLTALTVIATGLGGVAFTPAVSQAEDAFMEALTGGKVSFSARARYENVDDGNSATKDAYAYTLRTILGYKTGAFHGFSGFVEFEDVSHLGSDNFNAAGTNGEADYAIVADPEGTEVNQAYLAYNNFDTTFKFGRQIVTYRNAPFHRFIGTVGWRQNWQTFDAFSIVNKSLPDTALSYAYLKQVHTIFGEDRTVAPILNDGDIDMDSHLFNIQYSGLPIGSLEGYAYLLDYEDAPDDNKNSTATYGVRLAGAQAVNDTFKVIYTAEYATQDDYADGQMDSQNYYLMELGGKYKGWMLKLSHEVLEGDGVDAFRTPLGTNHAYQGWADKFLSTPAQGLEDTYVTLVGNIMGAKLVAAYHDFETDENSLDAGEEFDIMLAKTFKKHYTLGVKYADYDADDEFGGTDTEKFWLWGQVKF